MNPTRNHPGDFREDHDVVYPGRTPALSGKNTVSRREKA